MSALDVAEASRPARKLAHFLPLDERERRLLDDWAARARALQPGVDVAVEGKPYEAVLLVQNGWLARYRELKDGRRQIVNFLLPGDVFDLGALLFKHSAQTVATITKAVVTEIPPSEMLRVFETHTRLAVAMMWSAAQEGSIFSEHLVNVGRRSALERLAHILLELHRRLRAIGLAGDASFELPLTQVMLGDALGLTPVHISRSLRRLREAGAIRMEGQTLVINEMAKLKAMAGFESDFLHLGGAPEPVRRQLM